MSDVMMKILEVPAPFNLAIIAVVLGITVPIVAIIASEIRKFATHRQDLEAKRDMLDRGMPVEEIERVLQAGQEIKK